MNVYQKMLVRLFEETEGKDSVAVNFKELLKDEGFYQNYDDIFKQLSHHGWITDAGREGVVKITHWGVKEAKKSKSFSPDEQRELKKLANKLKDEIKEMSVMSEEFIADLSQENLDQLKEKLEYVKNVFEKLKANF